jgi:SAM-dependent methyltransferase
MFSPQQLSGSYLAGSLWWWTGNVFMPAQALKRAGVPVTGAPEGDLPIDVPQRGLGPYFSKRHREPVLLEHATGHDHLVEEFDRIPEIYETIVHPFSRPLFDEALGVMRNLLRPSSRVLDAGCGPGRELRQVASLVPDGEVVGIDLAAGMIEAAHASARSHGLDNCSFVHSDVGDLPREFTGKFDLVYNCLAHHHYPDPPAATAEIFRCLRPGGVYCVVDPGPAWFNAVSAPIARWADPGWIGFRTPDAFRELFRGAGFARTSWTPLLPGFGLAVGQKPRRLRAAQSSAV